MKSKQRRVKIVRNVKKDNVDDSNEMSSPGSTEGAGTVNAEVLTPCVPDVDPLLVESSRATGAKKRKRRKKITMKSETPDERKLRLAKMSAYASLRLANETPQQRAVRLKRMSQYAAKRLSQETINQRASRLARMSAYAAKKLAEESAAQRKARLARMSAYAAGKLTKKKISS